MSERIFQNLQTHLNSQNARYRVVNHESAGTSELVAKARGTQLGQGAKALVCIVKGVSESSFTQSQAGKYLAEISPLSQPFEALSFNAKVADELKLPSHKPSARNARIYVLAVFSADRRANLSRLAAAVGGTKASLVSEDECAALSDCVIGSIPPFSFHDRLLLVVDEYLFGRFDEIAFNAGLLDRSIILNTDDYRNAARPCMINFSDEI